MPGKSLIYTVVFFCSFSYAQDTNQIEHEPVQDEYFTQDFLRYEDHVYKETVKTVQLHKEGWALSYPFIELNSGDRLLLSFDDLTSDVKDYYYTVIHCDAAWKPSGINSSDYIKGFVVNPLNNYRYSINTFHSYIHYALLLPNDDIAFLISGNYIVKVFEDNDENRLVLTHRFSIVEQKIQIQASVKQSTHIDFRRSSHEVDFTLNITGLPVYDPFHDIKVVIRQNNRWDNAVTGLSPLIVRNNELVYDYDLENVFSGGSEYRNFDIKSVRYQSEYIRDIQYERPYYHVYLKSGEAKPFLLYSYDQDINGKFFVKIQEGNESEIEADYMYVHFSLPYEAPVVNGNIYVFGQLSDWNYNKSNRMQYSMDKRAYELTLLLKQGYYNYEYVLVEDKEQKADNTYIEGSHFETENDYLIYVYFRDNSIRYDRLAGLQIVNSLNK